MTDARRYATWVDRHRYAILGVALATALAGGALAAQLRVKSDFSYLLPERARSVQDLRAIEGRTRAFANLLVAVVADDPDRREQAARRLAERLAAIEGGLVADVVVDDGPLRRYVWEHRFLFAPLADLTAARDALEDTIARAKLRQNPAYIDFEEEDSAAADAASKKKLDELEARLKEAEAKAKQPGGLVAKDGRMQLLIVNATFPSTDAGKARALRQAVEAAIDETRREAGAGVEIGAAGDVVTVAIEHHAILSGMVLAIALTTALVWLGMLLYYRSFTAVMALVWSLCVGTLATFGVTRLAIGYLNTATAFLASIVIGNGINFPLILLARHLEERRAGRRGLDALAGAIGGTARGTLAAAAAAGIAYASLNVTTFRGFWHFGVIGGIGMALCWLSAYTVLPAALAVLERRGRFQVRGEPAVGPFLARLLPRRPAWVVGVSALIAAGSGVVTWRYLAQDPFEYDFRNLRSTGEDARRTESWMRRIDRAFGRGIAGGFVLASERREDTAKVRAALAAAENGAPADRQLLGPPHGLDDYLPEDQPAKLAVLADIRRRIDKELDALDDEERARTLRLRPPDDLRPLGDADVPELLARRYTERGGERGRLVFVQGGPSFDAWDGRRLVELAGVVRGLDLPEGTRAAGNAFVFADMLVQIERDGPRATLTALLGVILFAGLVIGFRLHGLVTIVCGVVGTTAMLALCALSGLRVNFLDFVALPITLGIAVDYAANVVARGRQEGVGGARRALATTGGAVLLCSYTTTVGYASLLISQNSAIRSFGLAAIVGEVTCVAAALFLAPALLSVLGRRPAAPAVVDEAPRPIARAR